MTVYPANNNSAPIDYFQPVPKDIKKVIFRLLDSSSLRACRLLCKDWNALAGAEFNERIEKVRTQAFGKKKWEKYFGEVGKEPPLPGNIIQSLNLKNPYNPTRTIAQDFFLVLIPATLNGEPFNFFELKKVIKNPKGGGHPAEIGGYALPSHVIGFDASYWAFVSRDVIPGSKGKSKNDHIELIKKQKSFSFPLIIEMMTAVFAYHAETGKSFYPKDTYSLCYDKDSHPDPTKQDHLCTGSYSESSGLLQLPYSLLDKTTIGMGVVARLNRPAVSLKLQSKKLVFLNETDTPSSDSSKKRKEPPS